MGQGTGPLCTAGGSPGWVRHWEQSDLCRGQRPAAAAATNVMDLLSAEGKKAINKCEAVVGIRNVYDYLIHDTEDCRKKGKEQYDPSERITGNNFDIGAYEQLGTAEKNEMFLEMG